MRLAILGAVLGLVVASAGASTPLTREEAADIVIGEVLSAPRGPHAPSSALPPKSGREVNVFLTENLLRAGDEVAPADEGAVTVIARDTWFAWIDDSAWAFFAHPTRFVFVDAETGDVDVRHELWWPVINGVHSFMSDAEQGDENIVIHSTVLVEE